MVLEIRDKVFDVFRIKNLLRQGENNVDTVSFVVKRYYNDLDLSTLSYVLYGDSQSNTRASIELEKEVLEDKLTLIWKIQKDFTAVAGTLTLLIKGYNTQKQEVIKFVGRNPIQVKKTDPNGATVVPPESEYDQALEKLYQILEEAKEVSMYPPRIGENDNWEVYNNVLNEYVDTGISVRGAQPKGEWSASATYQKLDIVSYQGSSFAVLKEISGIVPANDNINYMLIAQKGDVGKSAYEYAKESGFIGTEQEFAQAQSDILNAKNDVEKVKQEVTLVQTQVNQSATQVSNDKQAVETARQEVSLKHTEVLEKAEQVKANAESFGSSVVQAKQEIETSKTNAVQEINRSGETARQSVIAEGTSQTESVTNTGTQAVANVQSKATEQLSLIASAGTAEVQKVATEGAKQVQAATEQANLAKQSADSAASKAQEVGESVTAGKQEITTAKDAALSAVQSEGSKQAQAVNTAGTTQVQAVNDAGKAQTSAVQNEGAKQSKAVADAGAAQIAAVGNEGQKQVTAVQAEGQKQAEQIKAIESLLPTPTAQDAGKVPMVDAAGTGYELGKVVVDAYTKAEADALFVRKDELDLKVIETYYNLRRTGKVYQTKVWKFAANPTSVCEKLADNAGLVCEASTSTTEGRDDYANIPLLDWKYCNYIREDDGSPIPTAIEGMESYKESGAVDVGAMHMSFWWDIKDCGDYEIYTISDSPHPELGLMPWVECVREDGTVLPWCIGSAFVSSKGEDGLLRSLPNRKPERHQSYNNMMTNYGKKGKGYHGAGASNMVYQQLMMAIKYGTKSSQSVFGGCTGYSVQLPASIERAEADTYFPIKKNGQKQILCREQSIHWLSDRQQRHTQSG